MSEPASNPRFTIIVPTYNHGRWIETALRSIFDQGEPSIEVLVMDALSTDDTPAILERYRDRIVWHRRKDAGQADAINQGFALARGDVVAWLNSDDTYLPGALARVTAAFAANPAWDFVYGDALEISEDGTILTPNLFTEDCSRDRFYFSHDYICQPTLFVRRAALARVGSLRAELRWFLDYQWLTRFFAAGLHGQRLPCFLAANRDHPNTKTNSGGLRRWWEIMSVLASTPPPGPVLLARRCVWIYSLEFVIKSINAAQWGAQPTSWSATRELRAKLLATLNRWFMQLVSPRSFTDIVQRYEREILSVGRTTVDLWKNSAGAGYALSDSCASGANPTSHSMTPLEPNTQLKYAPLVRELHEALRTLLFPQLPDCAGRAELLAKLLGTGISEATYVLAELHAAIADDGDVCEFGVAQGATSALLANELRGTNKLLWLYDSFTGLPQPSPKDQLKDDIFGLGSIERYAGEMRCDAEEVQTRLAQIGIAPERYRVRAGLVNETLREENGPASVCFAYIDFDFYEPIAHALAYLEQHLTPNGRIVVDDYDFFSTGAKTAVDEFIQQTRGRFTMTLPHAFAGRFCLLRRKT